MARGAQEPVVVHEPGAAAGVEERVDRLEELLIRLEGVLFSPGRFLNASLQCCALAIWILYSSAWMKSRAERLASCSSTARGLES